MTVDPRGEWIQVSNETPKTLIVLGYVREPYLRIDGSGVAQNSFSPTLQLNQSLFGDLSQLDDSSLPASWTHTSDTHEVRWHDHRIHWMTADRPPVVKKNPSQPHLIGTWNVHMTLGEQPVTVQGTLSWLPVKPRVSRFMTYFVAADVIVFVLAVAGIALFISGRRRIRPGAAGAGAGSPPDQGLTGGEYLGAPGTVPASTTTTSSSTGRY